MTTHADKPCLHCGRPIRYGDHKTVWKKVKYCSHICYFDARRAIDADTVGRFWSKVEKRGADECWGWNAQKRWDGYGRFVHRYKPMWAHRFSYELHNGPIPKGMSVMHSCDKPECTNPAHLSLGTHAENMADAKSKRRHAHGERSTHAKLNENQVRQIRKLYKKTGPRRGNAKEVAARFGVTVGVIHCIGRGATWKYVT